MLVGIFIVALWLVLGYTALHAMIKSAGMPTGRGAAIAIILCGPISWYAEWHARRKDFTE